MAEAILYTATAEILKKLASTTLQQIDLAVGVKRELKKFEETLATVKVVLLDAEQKQSTNHPLGLWLEKLQHVLYDADNVLDAFEYRAIQQRLANRGSSKAKVRLVFTSAKFRFGMGYKIKELRERLDQISSNRAQFHLTEGLIDMHVMQRDRTHSFVNPSDVIGRDTDKNKILHLLTCTNIGPNLFVVPIVGMGGLGKTTIAKLVYNSIEVSQCFKLRMWVCVSDDFNVQKVTKDINDSATEGTTDCSGLSIDQLQICLRNNLKDKKFLLVLDDVWNMNLQKWKELRQLLINGVEGSNIIVTTRSLQTASIMGTTKPYILQGLSDNDCWSLFVRYAFVHGEEKNYKNLEIIGKKIIKKCKGIPLAVRSLGSMLFMKTDERIWLSIENSEIWRLEDNENDILQALRLSYNQLPSHLKRCFAFCSIFPKDFEFCSYTLIIMWMSQGLIHSTTENEEVEEIGLRYINELYSRYFFQDISDSDNYFDGMRFKMHDLVHDLSLLVSKNENYMISNISMPSTMSSDIRNVLICNREDVPTLFQLDLSNLWTLYCFPNYKEELGANESFVQECIARFKFLRMLDVKYSCFELLPRSIGSLKHLRYLNISYNENLKKLPDAICQLLHLQTLNLCRCTNLEELPRDIGNLINLRRLWITAKEIYLVPNKQIGLLTSLRDLRIYNCPNLITSYVDEDTKCLFPSLKKILFYNCFHLESWPCIMKHLPALETLGIEECVKLSNGIVQEDLSFTSLQYLKLSRLPHMMGLPEWVQGCSNTLQELHIERCSGVKSLPDWMRNLMSLRKLVVILESSQVGNYIELRKRWKIEHIPDIRIKIEYSPTKLDMSSKLTWLPGIDPAYFT